MVVPVLDEAHCIGPQLDDLARQPDLHEIIVVDGGSRDQTRCIARERGVRVIETCRGRGHQMNVGAHESSGAVILFLHCDVRLPELAARRVWSALADPQVVAGAFRTCTQPDAGMASPGWVDSLLWLADIRSRYSRLPYGDQALFVRRRAFSVSGGFPEIPLMEDLVLAKRLRRLGRIHTLPSCVRVSGRRFQARPVYYTLLMSTFPVLFRLGVPPRMLHRFYRDVR